MQVPPVQQIPRMQEEQVAPCIKLLVNDWPRKPSPKQVDPVQYTPESHIRHVAPATKNSQEEESPVIC